jgi:large subunit ribosomal protein L25
MADYITLPAQKRAVDRKKNKQLRRDGVTPIIVYGRHTSPAALQSETKTLAKVLSTAGTSSIIAIEVDGEDEPRLALARYAQRHVTKLSLLHVDFLQVAMDEVVRSDVPLRIMGVPGPVRANEALLDVLLSIVPVEALPADLPSSLEADVSGLEEIGEVVTIGDLATSTRFAILSDPAEVVARLTQLRIVELEVEEEEAEELEEGELEEGAEAEAVDESAGDHSGY